MKRLSLLICLAVLAGCSPHPKAPSGLLEISFQFNDPDSFDPSFQLAVWLESEADSIHTLFVSEYLSYGGYNDTTICPHWSKQADWDHSTDEEFDAVTRATPPLGANTLSFDLDTLNLQPGNYQLWMQTHVEAETNVLVSSDLNFREPFASQPEPVAEPPNPATRQVLTDVQISFKPEK